MTAARFHLKNCATGAYLSMDQDGQLRAQNSRGKGCSWLIQTDAEGNVTLTSDNSNGRTLDASRSSPSADPAVFSHSDSWHMERFSGNIIGLRDANRKWLGVALLPVAAYADPSPTSSPTSSAPDSPTSSTSASSSSADAFSSRESSVSERLASWEPANKRTAVLLKAQVGQAEAWELRKAGGFKSLLSRPSWRMFRRSLSS